MLCAVYNTLLFSLPGEIQLFLLALARLRFLGPDSFTEIPRQHLSLGFSGAREVLVGRSASLGHVPPQSAPPAAPATGRGVRPGLGGRIQRCRSQLGPGL